MRESADDGVRIAGELHALIGRDRARIIGHERSTVAAIQLLESLPAHPVVTAPRVTKLLDITPPTARKAIDLLTALGVLRETTGKQRDRVYAYDAYMQILMSGEA